MSENFGVKRFVKFIARHPQVHWKSHFLIGDAADARVVVNTRTGDYYDNYFELTFIC